jgi:hypothetical protein
MTTGSSSDEDLDVIERLDAGEPPRSAEEAQARAPYEKLLVRVRDLDDVDPPPGWEDRAASRWSAARRKRQRGMLVGAAASVAVAVAAVLLLQPCSPAHRLEVATLTERGSQRRGDTAVGDRLHARARVDRPHVELRIYLGTRRVARCPDDAMCRRDASALEIDWEIREAGTYRLVVLSSASSIPAGDGTLDRDLLDARGAGASIESQSFPVSP